MNDVARNNALNPILPACNPPEMAIAITNDTARATPSSNDDSITPDVDLETPSRLDAFDALGRAMGTKKSLKEQIRDAKAIIDLPLNPKLYPKIQGPDKRLYHLRAHFKLKDGPSWINAHGTLLLRLTENDSSSTDGKFWACHECYNIFDAEATTSAAKHLRQRHGITKDGQRLGANAAGKRSSPAIDELFQARTTKKTKLPPPAKIQGRFQELLVKWVADSDIPFSVVEHEHFRSLLSILNSTHTDDLLPRSHVTTRNWLKTQYNLYFDALKTEITVTPNPIHISFDGWSSPGTAAFFAVVAHYFDAAGDFNTRLLALPRIKGTHNGENLAKGVIEVVERFGFEAKLGGFQADNAENNDTCVTELLRHFNPHLSTPQLDLMRSLKRVRCVGHILNLVARAFLDGENKEVIRKLAEGSDERLSAEQERELLNAWRETGPVGKLPYLVHFARRTPQRRDAFNDFIEGITSYTPPKDIIFSADLVSFYRQAHRGRTSRNWRHPCRPCNSKPPAED